MEPKVAQPIQPTPPSSAFVAGLDKVRTRLLDLTLANRLIHFKHSPRSSLRVIDELPDVLFTRLMDGDELQLVPVPEPPPRDDDSKRPPALEHAVSIGIDPSFDLPEPPADGAKAKPAHRDAKIQTALFPNDLESCMRAIASAARSALDETGTNMLHLAFGFLDWAEQEHPKKRILAPLITVPVAVRRGDIDPRTRTYRYYLSHSGEDIAANLSLAEKVRRDFGVVLPAIQDDDTPEVFMGRVAGAIVEVPEWRVRRQVTLCLLSFGKLLMFRDLDPERWPEGQGPLTHPRVRELFEGVERRPYDVCREHPLDDANAVPDLPPIVMDADSSQHSALVDVLRGRNLVIQGPPGTGKSQTIANLIAAAMIRGKSVLFVAEKLAALEVVRRRLDAVGLGLFCVELHSHKTQKHRLLKDFAARLEARGSFPDVPGLDEKLDLVAATRAELTAHIELLHQPVGSMGKTIFDVLWGRAIRGEELDELLPTVRDASFPDPAPWNLAAFESVRTSVNAYAEHLTSLRKHVPRWIDHPWAGINQPPEPGDDPKMLAAMEQLRMRATELRAEAASLLSETGAAVEASHAALQPWLHEVAYLSSLRGVQHTGLLIRVADDASRGALGSYCDALDAVARLTDSLRALVPNPVLDDSAVEGVRQAVATLSGLSNRAPVLGDVDTYLASLSEARQRLLRADALRAEVSRRVGCDIPGTLGGLAATAEILELAHSAPLAHLELRGPGLDLESSERVFRASLNEAQAIWQLRSDLAQRFELSLLPSVEELKRRGGACATAGTFRFLSTEYQAARQCYGAFSKRGAPDQPQTLANDFQQLASYVARVEAFANNEELRRVIGPGFRGMDTPFQEIATIRGWQLCAVQTLHWALPAAKTVAERVALASESSLRAVASLVPDPAAERNATQSALGSLQNALADARGGSPASQELPVAHAIPMLDDLVARLQGALQSLRAAGFSPACPTSRLAHGLDGLAALGLHRRALDQHQETRAILGPLFGTEISSASLRQLLQLAHALEQTHLPRPLREWLRDEAFASRVELLLNRSQHILAAIRNLDAAHAQLDAWVGLDRNTWYRGGPAWGTDGTADVVVSRLTEALDNTDKLPAWRGLLRSRAELQRLELGHLVGLVESGAIEPATLWPVCEFLFHDRLASQALKQHPSLASFDGMVHQELRARFCSYDTDTIEAYRKRAARFVDQRPIPEGIHTGPVASYTDLALLEHECRKQRRHVPIRQLVRRASGAMQALAPCFMMGPRAVAQYLEPGALTFDILVMDEASQLRPEDAIGAICRTRQVVIVGDPKQLPPTSFFDRMSDPDDVDADEATTFDDAESILDVASYVYSPVRRLRWHYRSRHESLIAFSNEQFYDGSLVVFPSPRSAANDLGLRFEHVDGAVYESGLNDIEARRVVDAIVEHLKSAPDSSLGVVAMNFKQRDRIEELLHARLKDDDATRAIADEASRGAEPLFVKNLENVQGDERDVIFVSVTYGKGTDGRLLQRFGPLNGTAGPRRLNVLFTRAKRKLVVFASFEPEELVLGDGAADGAKVLQKYLAVARDRTRAPRDWGDNAPSTDMERAVVRALSRRGYESVVRVGVAGAHVDVAVRHPDDRSELLMGIEADGPGQLASHSARDRERLLPSALRNLGWNVFTLWSVDWYRDPAGTVQRLVDAIEASRKV